MSYAADRRRSTYIEVFTFHLHRCSHLALTFWLGRAGRVAGGRGDAVRGLFAVLVAGRAWMVACRTAVAERCW